MVHKWIRFEDALPTDNAGEQVNILFGHPKWATYMRGMYTHFPDIPLRERISEYKPDIDKFWEWESMMPTHWMLLPENPTDGSIKEYLMFYDIDGEMASGTVTGENVADAKANFKIKFGEYKIKHFQLIK